MASSDFSYNTSYYHSNTFDEDWGTTDPSAFLYDSPQPDQPLDSQSIATELPPDTNGAFLSSQENGQSKSVLPSAASQAEKIEQYSVSESSSQSSSSGPSAGLNRNNSSTSSPRSRTEPNPSNSMDPFKNEKSFSDINEDFQMDDSVFPRMGQGMDNLSLDGVGPNAMSAEYDFNTSTTSPGPFADGQDWPMSRNIDSPQGQMTVQPSKMFVVGEDSPNSAKIMNSHESSPAAFYQENSPAFSGADNGFGNQQPGNLPRQAFDQSPVAFANIPPTSMPQTSVSPSGDSGSSWPCLLTVDSTPEKSRVETQIPIKLTLHNVPQGVTKLHLPPHSISKPKFQAKPTPARADDTLELYTMLVCASAMQKEGARQRALQRAAVEDTPVKHEDQPQGDKVDDEDPNRPLNGGPVAICPGCIVRERKRAARKKTKKVEEEEEWAKDEAKRVIVFNCPEVRDWCIPGTKEIPVKDHDRPLASMFVNAPMRIACYCRHQNEKIGFQVIFTIKDARGNILAQAMSNSIMITDDHKQPVAHPNAVSGLPYSGAPSATGHGMFSASGQPLSMFPSFEQNMPFRTSWSTNDLRLMNNPHYQAHPQRPTFQRQFSNEASQQSTGSATPRNLSRPASPTDPSGHSTKKRRSGGPGHQKIPSGLAMTRIETRSPPGPTSGNSSAMTSAPPSSGFNFQSPTANAFGNNLERALHQSQMAQAQMAQLQSGPSTPMGIPPNYGSPPLDQEAYQYYSAPTSQHPSRAPSPNSAARMLHPAYNSQIPQQAASALSSLPAGLNLQKPPLIQKIIPPSGPSSGGQEVTILGSGFCQDLHVMFGDILSPKTIFWGDTTLVSAVPPGLGSGQVAVMFKHQHHTAPPALREVQGLMPTRHELYTYEDDASTLGSLPLSFRTDQL